MVELFEARKPKDPAVISEIDGAVKYGGVVKGQRKILIIADDPNAEPREYSIPRGVHVNVQEGDRVRAGDPLMDGPSNPHDMPGPQRGSRAGVAFSTCWARRSCRSTWSTKSRRSTSSTPWRQVRAMGTPAAGRQHQRGPRRADCARWGASDKHIEVITRQMMRWVRVEDVGDTEFLIDEQVDPSTRCGSALRDQPVAQGRQVPLHGRKRAGHRQPGTPGCRPSRSSRRRRSGGAPDARTLRVGVRGNHLRPHTEAAISAKIDYLHGLKENVTMGRLIPAGTGFWWYRHVQIPADDPPPPPVQQPSDDELELDREMEYLVEPDEAIERGITEVE